MNTYSSYISALEDVYVALKVKRVYMTDEELPFADELLRDIRCALRRCKLLSVRPTSFDENLDLLDQLKTLEKKLVSLPND